MGLNKGLASCLIECLNLIGQTTDLVVFIFYDEEDRKYEMVFDASKPFVRRVDDSVRYSFVMRVDFAVIETLSTMEFGNLDLFKG